MSISCCSGACRGAARGARIVAVWRRVVRSIYMALVPVATMCMWLMWVCTWLHQWHPIILPTKHAESVQA
jgi:V-type H+-transporting ATPase subunit e